MKLLRSLLILTLLTLAFTACAPAQSGPAKAELPAGKAYAEGQEIFFVHTEASDPAAENLSKMMDSLVIYVPSLTQVPADALANVYVFTNGVEGSGPFGFQPDVFDSFPGMDGYSPLRRLNAVSWVDPAKARVLMAAADVLAAQVAGELTIEQPGIVINMPFVVWAGGQR